MKFLFKTGCFSLFSVFLWISAFAASGPITVNVDVPPGQWKAARLKNLPKDAMVAVRAESNGEVLVALMLMLNQKSRALGAADFAVKNPSAFNTMTKLFQDDRHPLSARRGRCVLCWAKDSDLPKKWQSQRCSLTKNLRPMPSNVLTLKPHTTNWTKRLPFLMSF